MLQIDPPHRILHILHLAGRLRHGDLDRAGFQFLNLVSLFTDLCFKLFDLLALEPCIRFKNADSPKRFHFALFGICGFLLCFTDLLGQQLIALFCLRVKIAGHKSLPKSCRIRECRQRGNRAVA